MFVFPNFGSRAIAGKKTGRTWSSISRILTRKRARSVMEEGRAEGRGLSTPILPTRGIAASVEEVEDMKYFIAKFQKRARRWRT